MISRNASSASKKSEEEEREEGKRTLKGEEGGRAPLLCLTFIATLAGYDGYDICV